MNINMIKLTSFIVGCILFHSVSAQLHLLQNYPQTYIAYRSKGEINMDGIMNETDWQNVPWSESFVDIEGDKKPAPLHSTRVKIMWDDNYLYIAAELEEPHIWATFTKRDTIIYHENNFEVFIDPDGDSHNYYEYEVNALGTEWDLFMTKPYRNQGIPMSSWHITGLKKGIHINGTNNNPADTDSLWTVEIAFPWEIIRECAKEGRRPNPSEQWRINFSRVEWQLDVVKEKYVKRKNQVTGNTFPEYNWVWSPQWAIDMHRPELWGLVQFSDIEAGKGKDTFVKNPDEETKFALRELYYLQLAFFKKTGRYTDNFSDLIKESLIINNKRFNPSFEVSNTRFKISAPSSNNKAIWQITEDGRIWSN